MLDDLLTTACSQRVSDVHIYPDDACYTIRFRIDGSLKNHRSLMVSQAEQLISRIKILSHLDIAERRRPQDGTFTFGTCDIRVATFPSLHGEKIALRILDRSGTVRTLLELGLSEAQVTSIENMLGYEGFFLVTGSTGSGKTTTVHTLLSKIATPELHCVTLEDPIEYTLKGVTQTQIHPEIGLTFETGLRALLRQDPDCIALGEIRDIQTAQSAFHAALTGHQVLSTLHATTAIGALTRLVSLGVDRYLIADALNFVIAQRLVRRVCDACSTIKAATDEQQQLLSEYNITAKQIRFADPCYHGSTGRVGIFQLLTMTPQIRRLILAGASEDELRVCAFQQGMTSLTDQAGRHLIQGRISFDRWLQVMMVEKKAAL